MSFFDELKRRNVYRVGIAYIVVTWVILQVADVILGNIEAPTWIFQVLLLVLAIGFPLALLLAWAFELTPEGLKREDEVDRSRSTHLHKGRKMDFAIIALLALALGYFGYDKFVLSAKRQATTAEATAHSLKVQKTDTAGVVSETDKSIAILPFLNFSPDPDQEYFADGLAEELLNLLAKIPVLRVIARTSSFSYKNKDIKITDVARELDVNYVLEGSVRKSGDTIRVTAQLIRASDSSHLWSEVYEDRRLDDVFAIQDDIAAAVVAQLKLKLFGTVPTSEETDPRAYALYLQARELSRQSTAEGHNQSIALYRQALEIAPDYAAAWTGLAENYIFLSDRSLIPIEEGFAQARDAANKALAIDPNYPLAHASVGWIAMVHDHDLDEAAVHLKRALEMEPANPQIIRPAATLLLNLGRLQQAIVLLEYGVARDPVGSALYSNLGLSNYCAGRLDEAISAYQTALSLSPDAIGVQSFIGEALLAKNEPEAALAAMEQEPSEPWRLIGEVMTYHAMGQTTESDAKLAELIEKYGSEWPYNISYVMAYRDEVNRAFEWLDKARQYNDPGLSEIVVAPEFASARSDPRWLPFLDSIGKAPHQLDAVEFEVGYLKRE